MSWLQKNLDNRRIFMETLSELADKDSAVCLIVCDVGFSYTEDFKKQFPNQYWNLGTTEPSSMAEAAGMALAGMKPYIYSMINFVTFRVHEMVRNAIVKHNANVKILGVKGSEKYKFLGFSHNLLFEDEEIEWLSKLMPCYKPKLDEVSTLIETTYREKGPAYIRL